MLIWNIKGFFSTQRQVELKQLTVEMKLEIFGLSETKLSDDRYNQLCYTLADDWDSLTNKLDENQECSSILLKWKKNTWKGELLLVHNQILHCRLTNIGGYSLDLSVA